MPTCDEPVSLPAYKLYYSREDRIAELHDQKDRIQYDGNDGLRITEVTDTAAEFCEKMCDALDRYVDSEDDEELEYNRRNAIECWALAQASLSKVAWVMRFDGNLAYQRMINALKTGAAADMRGL
jgi:hypothetical protein